MGVFRTILNSSSLILNAGAIVLLFFVVLAGARNVTPLNQLYWLQADTSGIPGAPQSTRWTPYGYCESKDGKNFNCSKNKPDFAFQPDRTFNTTSGVPQDFIQNHDTYYYLSRFTWPFHLIALVFVVLEFFLSFTAFASRLGSALTATLGFIAWIFSITASALATAVYVMGKNKFGNGAKLGVKLMAFTWTATALLTITFFVYGLGCCFGGRKNRDTYPSEKSSFRASSRTGSRRGFFSVRNRDREEYPAEEAYPEAGSAAGGAAVQPVSSYERGV